MAVFALQIATLKIAVLLIAMICHNSNNPLAKNSALWPYMIHEDSLGLWQSTLKFRLLSPHCRMHKPRVQPPIYIANVRGKPGVTLGLHMRPVMWALTLAISSTAIFNVAICRAHTGIGSTEISNRVKSSPHYFTSKGPLFEASYIL
jgi:hypothetical protein